MFLSTCVEYMSLYLIYYILVNIIVNYPPFSFFWRKPPSYLGKYNRNIIRRVYPYYGHTIWHTGTSGNYNTLRKTPY